MSFQSELPIGTRIATTAGRAGVIVGAYADKGKCKMIAQMDDGTSWTFWWRGKPGSTALTAGYGYKSERIFSSL